jgi:hypothetical protein
MGGTTLWNSFYVLTSIKIALFNITQSVPGSLHLYLITLNSKIAEDKQFNSLLRLFQPENVVNYIFDK